MSVWSSLGFPDAVSPLMEEMLFFHDSTMAILCGITVFVLIIMGGAVTNRLTNTGLLEGQTIELIWTVLPAVILLFIGLPSLRLLYALDEASDAALTLKVVGHQWYWSYEYSGFLDLSFDSYMLPSGESESQFRLLDVDNRVVLPTYTPIRVLVSATDVLHSWTVPTLGVKADGVPGRLNQLSLLIGRPGVFVGQCSEICGANHSFMPIVVEGVGSSSFLEWLETA